MGQNAKTEFKWAIIGSLLGLLLLVILKFAGMRSVENFGTGGMIDMIGTILIMGFVFYKGLGEKKTDWLDGTMTYSQGFWTAAIITLMLIPLNAAVAWCYVECFDTNFLANWSAAEKINMGIHGLLKITCMMIAIIGLILSLMIPFFVQTKTDS